MIEQIKGKAEQKEGEEREEGHRGGKRRRKGKEGHPQVLATILGEFKHLQPHYHPVASFKGAQGRTI